MRESRSYGSVRGVAGDRYPYRDLEVHSAPPKSFQQNWVRCAPG